MIDLHTFVAGWIAGLATGVGLMRLKRKPACCELLMPPSRDCDTAWRSGELVRMDEGRVQRGNGNGAPATPKPDIIPKPQFPPPRKIREDFLP